MVNSATAEALRPGVFTTSTPRSRAAAMSMLTGPPRLTAISFSPGSRSSIAAGHRRQMVDQDLRLADELGHGVGVALILLQPRQARAGIAVGHRLVRPRQLQRAQLDVARPPPGAGPWRRRRAA